MFFDTKERWPQACFEQYQKAWEHGYHTDREEWQFNIDVRENTATVWLVDWSRFFPAWGWSAFFTRAPRGRAAASFLQGLARKSTLSRNLEKKGERRDTCVAFFFGSCAVLIMTMVTAQSESSGTRSSCQPKKDWVQSCLIATELLGQHWFEHVGLGFSRLWWRMNCLVGATAWIICIGHLCLLWLARIGESSSKQPNCQATSWDAIPLKPSG